MQKRQSKPARESELVEDLPKAPNRDDLKVALDDLLDDIDSVLEENAEAFVKGYQQRGGE